MSWQPTAPVYRRKIRHRHTTSRFPSSVSGAICGTMPGAEVTGPGPLTGSKFATRRATPRVSSISFFCSCCVNLERTSGLAESLTFPTVAPGTKTDPPTVCRTRSGQTRRYLPASKHHNQTCQINGYQESCTAISDRLVALLQVPPLRRKPLLSRPLLRTLALRIILWSESARGHVETHLPHLDLSSW